jgi:hypothetical protein
MRARNFLSEEEPTAVMGRPTVMRPADQTCQPKASSAAGQLGMLMMVTRQCEREPRGVARYHCHLLNTAGRSLRADACVG